MPLSNNCVICLKDFDGEGESIYDTNRLPKDLFDGEDCPICSRCFVSVPWIVGIMKSEGIPFNYLLLCKAIENTVHHIFSPVFKSKQDALDHFQTVAVIEEYYELLEELYRGLSFHSFSSSEKFSGRNHLYGGSV